MDSSHDGETTVHPRAVPDEGDAGTRHIDVTPLGRSRAPVGSIELLTGGRVLLMRPPVAGSDSWTHEVHERESLLSGAGFLSRRSQPLSSLELSSISVGAAPDGTFVASEGTTVWCVAPDGSRRWQLADDVRPAAAEWFRVRGKPSVSPDGSQVAVVVSMPVTEDDEPSEPASFVYDGPRPEGASTDVLLLLDTASGEVLARQEAALNSVDARFVWHPAGGLLAASCWGLWQSWTTHWFEADGSGLRRLGGMTMGEAGAFVPGSSRLLTVRRAENFALDDDVNELASYDPRTSERLALVDHEKLLVAPDSPGHTDVHPLDSQRVILESSRLHEGGKHWETVHWLLDAHSLRPLGRLRYPGGSVPSGVKALGDGTWLTRLRGSLVRHWALS